MCLPGEVPSVLFAYILFEYHLHPCSLDVGSTSTVKNPCSIRMYDTCESYVAASTSYFSGMYCWSTVVLYDCTVVSLLASASVAATPLTLTCIVFNAWNRNKFLSENNALRNIGSSYKTHGSWQPCCLLNKELLRRNTMIILELTISVYQRE